MVERLSALASPVRLDLIKLLENGEKCICEINPKIDKSQPAISIHLNKLYQAGLVERRKEGKKVFYKLTNKELPKILKMIKK